MRYVSRFLVCLLYIHILFICHANGAIAFNEEFSGKIVNNSDWFISNSTGLSFSPNTVILSSEFSTAFPYLDTTNEVFNSDEVIEVRFRYLSAGSAFGDGFAFTDIAPTYPYPSTGEMRFPSDFIKYSIFYVWQDGTPSTINLHIASSLCPEDNNLCAPNIRFVYKSSNPDFDWHVLKIVPFEATKYQLYLDDSLIFTSASNSRRISKAWIGHPSILNHSDNWSSFEIDYMSSTDFKQYSFPYYSQLDPRWEAEEYDHASEWSAPGERGIGRWGCALTSASMILSNKGVKSPDGEVSNPPTLNNWLISQPDGYLRNGLLNWLAVSRFSREAYAAGQSPVILEFSRSQYTSDVELVFPSILGEPGHFVVAHDQSETDLQIFDPLVAERTEAARSEGFRTINTFTDSETDLSYILLVSNKDMALSLSDSSGAEVGQTFIDSPIQSGQDKSGEELKTIYFQNPESGTYALVTGPGLTEAFWYDIEGNVKQKELDCLDSAECLYQIEFAKEDAAKGEVSQVVQESFEELVWRLHGQGKIKTKRIAQNIIKYYKMRNYTPVFAKRFRVQVEQMLRMYIRMNMWGRKITGDAGQELLNSLSR